MITIESISARLRAIRIAKGLSLSDVERLSGGAIPAVVLGSYERGDRSLSVKKAILIANFYELPLTYLLAQPSASSSAPLAYVVDLRSLTRFVREKESKFENLALRSVITFISGIVNLRNDWNGEVLSIRSTDLTAMALAIGKSHEDVVSILHTNNLLIKVK